MATQPEIFEYDDFQEELNTNEDVDDLAGLTPPATRFLHHAHLIDSCDGE